MQDRDIPPEAEGRTNGAEVGVRPNEVPEAVAEVQWAETANRDKAFSRLPWITTIAPTWAAIMADVEGGAGLALVPRTLHWIPNLSRHSTRTPLRGFLPSSKTCSFLPKSRRPGAR